MNDNYCAMIHGGLWLNFVDYAHKNKVGYQFCCLNSDKNQLCDLDVDDLWNSLHLQNARKVNLNGEWNKHCLYPCKAVEASGESFRLNSNKVFGKEFPSGPKRLDIKLSNKCNLACQICDDMSS